MTSPLSSGVPYQLNTFNNSVCIDALKIYTNWAFVLTLTCVFVLDVISIFLLSFVVVKLFFSKAIHIHLKILVINVGVAFVIRNSLTGLRAGYFVGKALVYAFINFDPCFFVIKFIPCRLYSDAAGIPLITILFGIQFLVFERLIAAFRSTVYESARHPWFLLCFVGIGILIPFAVAIKTSWNVLSSSTVSTSYCSSISTKDFSTSEGIMFAFFFFVSLVLGSISLLVVSHRIKLPAQDGYGHVSTKYQLLESRLYTSIFTYSNLICGALTTVSFVVCGSIYDQKKEMDFVYFAVIKELTSMVMPIYGCVLGVCFIVLHRPMRAAFRKKFFCKWPSSSTTVAPTSTSSNERLFFARRRRPNKSTTHEYFEYYQQQWN